jgi:predicted CXXCH cytochrome family protein
MLAFGLAVALASSAGFASARATHEVTPRVAEAVFPHARHAPLFPTCGGCHAGIPAGDSATMFPPATACAACHNGQDVKTVAWTPYRRPPTNLRFDHVRHTRPTDSVGTTLDCMACHGEGAVPGRMVIARPKPETCLGCHAHTAPTHLAASSPCATCHVPLVRAVAFNDSTIAALPKPPSHAAPEFVAMHGAQAQQSIATCATCHARESCTRCHVNADRVRSIGALASDVRVARVLRGTPAVYPRPVSHTKTDFGAAHGGLARANVETCATCHAQPSCRSCHTGTLGGRVIEALPSAAQASAPGVQLFAARSTPLPPWPDAGFTTAPLGTTPAISAAVVATPPRAVRVHALDIVRTHGAIASSGRLACAGCHAKQSFCTSCHQGAGERRYHPFDFVVLHPAEAYTRQPNCTSCHNTEVFCRSCHRDVAGIAAGSNRRSGAAHSGQPVWLLQHGEAARRGMPSCTTCHQQRDCMQCHSALGGRVNPHGPDFDADRMRKKNPTLCSYCHLVIPRG